MVVSAGFFFGRGRCKPPSISISRLLVIQPCHRSRKICDYKDEGQIISSTKYKPKDNRHHPTAPSNTPQYMTTPPVYHSKKGLGRTRLKHHPRGALQLMMLLETSLELQASFLVRKNVFCFFWSDL